MKFLYKCRISITNNNYTLNCKPLNSEKYSSVKTIVFRGSDEGFKLFLRRIKAKDTQTSPASVKKHTYQFMIDTAKDGSDPYVYVWSHMLPKESIIREKNEFLESNMKAREFIEYTESILKKSSITQFLDNIVRDYKTKMEEGFLYTEIIEDNRYKNFEDIIEKFLQYLWDYYFKDIKKECSVVVYCSSIFPSFTVPIEFGKKDKPNKFIVYVNTSEDSMSYILENISHEFIHISQYHEGMKKEGDSIFYQNKVYKYIDPSENYEMYLNMTHEKDAYYNEEDIVSLYKEEFSDHIFEKVKSDYDYFIMW